jgi:hypothetical protein
VAFRTINRRSSLSKYSVATKSGKEWNSLMYRDGTYRLKRVITGGVKSLMEGSQKRTPVCKNLLFLST